MSDEQNKSTEPTEKQRAEARQKAVKGSLLGVQETQKLLRSGHFAGARAHKLVQCLAFLEALENQIKAELK